MNNSRIYFEIPSEEMNSYHSSPCKDILAKLMLLLEALNMFEFPLNGTGDGLDINGVGEELSSSFLILSSCNVILSKGGGDILRDILPYPFLKSIPSELSLV